MRDKFFWQWHSYTPTQLSLSIFPETVGRQRKKEKKKEREKIIWGNGNIADDMALLSIIASSRNSIPLFYYVQVRSIWKRLCPIVVQRSNLRHAFGPHTNPMRKYSRWKANQNILVCSQTFPVVPFSLIFSFLLPTPHHYIQIMPS